MSIFGSSPRTDERRRRRLAAESGRSGRAVDSRRGSSRNGIKGAAQLQFSLTEIIPTSFASLFGTFLLCLAGAILIPTLGYFDQSVTTQAGPAVAWLFSLTTHPCANWLGSLLLILSAHLSLFIFWARSKSQTDFRGSFRLWRTVAVVCLFYSFLLTNRGHLVWSRTLMHLWPEKIKGQEVLAWVVPAIALAYWIGRQVLAEMRESLAARATLSLGFLSLLVTVLDSFDSRFTISSWSPRFLESMRLGLQLMGQSLIFLSLWLHARYVLFVSVEPPQERYSRLGWFGWIFAILGSLLALIGLGGSSSGSKRKGRKGADSAKSRKRTTKSTDTDEEAAETEGEEESSEEEAVEEGSAPARGGKNYRFDPPEESLEGPHSDGTSRDDMKGLSKKERRRLIQQQRDEERRRQQG